MKTQCLYGLVVIYPPSPTYADHKIPIGREKYLGGEYYSSVVPTTLFFSFLISLFLRKEGGVGDRCNHSVAIENFQGGNLVGADRGVQWN